MLDCFAQRPSPETVSIVPVNTADLKKRLNGEETRTAAWLEATGFKGKTGQVTLMPDQQGRLARVFVGYDGEDTLWSLADLPARLPPGRYALEASFDRRHATRAALGWALGSYGFTRYRKKERKSIDLVWPGKADQDEVLHT